MLHRYQATLYSHPDGPGTCLDDLEENLYKNLEKQGNYMLRHLRPDNLIRHSNVAKEKRNKGQPTSFTDMYGDSLKDVLLSEVC